MVTALIEEPRWLTLLLADVVKYQSGIREGGLCDELLLRQLAERFPSERLFALFHQWQELMALKERCSGINFPLQMSSLLISLKLPNS